MGPVTVMVSPFFKKLFWLGTSTDIGIDRNTNAPKAAPNVVPMHHVSEVSSCVNFGVLRAGDLVEVRATYNTSAHFMNRNIMHGHGDMVSWFTTPEDPKFA
jgi:hypothetical protein